MHNARPSIPRLFFILFLLGTAKERPVLPHQHYLGDSISLSDSLCRTDKNHFYSTGVYVGVKTTRVSHASLTTPAIPESLTGTATLVKGMLGMQEQFVSGRS